MFINFVTSLIVCKITSQPPIKVQKLVEKIRLP
jgi:Na+(H+)/acetate symporter ActP